ncbi:hypothetical protein QLQ85_08825 [Halomonas sp. M4R5S39]|uniref:hypothetical protein n=1 Tax=Halomonas kalidii TaxID=3043293 RepID=UPI0024A8A205|nr:hypothetical protein [Halomonas kalidii]MDI5984893.1 hypothetical protein [Halomonas kalidii]
MVRALIGLALLGGTGYWLLGRQDNPRAFGVSGIPYLPNLGAFDDTSGIPYSREELDRREALTLDDGSLDLNLGWLTDDWLSGPSNTVNDLINGDWSIWDMTDPRGIRNNNPGNIEYDPRTAWQGLADPPTDGRFARFVDPLYGIRAMSRILDTYRDRHGLNTVQSIVSRWAPAHENNTLAYQDFVASRVGVSPTQPLNDGHRPELIAAMIQMENGAQPYELATIQQGVSMA